MLPVRTPRGWPKPSPPSLLRLTGGRALIATGSPFEPVERTASPRSGRPTTHWSSPPGSWHGRRPGRARPDRPCWWAAAARPDRARPPPAARAGLRGRGHRGHGPRRRPPAASPGRRPTRRSRSASSGHVASRVRGPGPPPRVSLPTPRGGADRTHSAL
ncbi:hypothetical protein [Streptomyces purpurascens]